MTPNLLDELEKIVALSEKATPGEWRSRPEDAVVILGGNRGGFCIDACPDASENAAFIAASVNFLRTHAHALADMAKRMEAAERDSKRLDWLADRNNSVGQVLLPTASVEANLHDMRAAIDHAIAATQEGEG